MIEKHLGRTIDIHGGGVDLVFPHHENEIAQSSAPWRRNLRRYWLHNGFVNVDNEKMSKSTGNVLLVHELLKKAPGEAIRLALLNAHHSALGLDRQGSRSGKRMLDRLYGALRTLRDTDPDAVPSAVLAALNDDLNTPKALATLFDLARQANTASDAGEEPYQGRPAESADLMGLLQHSADDWFGKEWEHDGIDAEEIERLIEARHNAKADKDYAEADRSGTNWRPGIFCWRTVLTEPSGGVPDGQCKKHSGRPGPPPGDSFAARRGTSRHYLRRGYLRAAGLFEIC